MKCVIARPGPSDLRFSFDLDEKVMRVGFLDLIKNPVF
jgi:hypothetical protein